MQALEVEADISSDGDLVNARLPKSCKQWFGSHAKLIVVFPDAESGEVQRRQRIARWQALLKETQALPSAKSITDAEIDAEIVAYRDGR